MKMLMCLLKLFRSSVLILLLFTGCSHPFCEELKIIEPLPSGPQTITFRPGPECKDATISSYYPDSNFAVGKSLNLIAWTVTRNRILEKFYIDFDLSKVIPPGAKVTSAVLNLSADVSNVYFGYRGHVNSPEDYKLKINIITSPWEETSISWFNQPSIDQSELSVINGPSRYTQKYSVNITTYVQGKLNKDSNVKGLSFNFYEKVNSITDCMIRFCSSNHQSEELRPELTINYEVI